jgi:Ca-activated chloride channel family protein
VDVDLLVRLQAPDAPAGAPAPRAPLHLALVLDRSGSMHGTPLEEAKRCAVAVMERLDPSDKLALVAYDYRARVVAPLAAVTDRSAFRGAVKTIRSGGNTDLHHGWETGLAELRSASQEGAINRILLLSDGQANAGITDPARLAELCGQAQQQGVSTSTYGLGMNFEEGLMTALAKAGQGRAYYGETAEDLMDPFMEEFDLLANLWARELRLTLKAAAGVTITALNGYAQDGSATWVLPDLALGSEAWAVFRLKVKPSRLAKLAAGAAFTLAEVTVAWRDTQGQPASLPAAAFALPVLDATAFAALTPEPLVARRVGELRAAELQDLAYKACLEDDWAEVKRLLDLLRELAKENPWTQATLTELEAMAADRDSLRFRKETSMLSNSLTSRLAEKLEILNDMQPSNLSYLRRKPRQGKAEPREDDAP